MERLTESNKCRCDICEVNDDGVCLLPDAFPCDDYKRYYRLADIEDILGEDYDLDRLKELIQSDKAGRILIIEDAEFSDVATFNFVNSLLEDLKSGKTE